MEQLIVDADVLIDYLRGHEQAREFIRENRHRLGLSVITVAELYSGYKGDTEKQLIIGLCSYFPKTEVTEEIAIDAGLYFNQYAKSHGCGLSDCIIAATAKHALACVATLNAKHYPMLTPPIPYRKNAQ